MKVWLDDKDEGTRKMPEGYDRHAKEAQTAINWIEGFTVTEISLDHDLGDESIVGSGYTVAKHIEERAFQGCIPRIKWHLHTDNPVGRDRMRVALENADRYWDNHEKKGTQVYSGVICSQYSPPGFATFTFHKDNEEYHTDFLIEELPIEHQKDMGIINLGNGATTYNGFYAFWVICNGTEQLYFKRMKLSNENKAEIAKRAKHLKELFNPPLEDSDSHPIVWD